MARKQHTHHYIYKTTCNITGKYYIGMHSTSNLSDGYIGSGRRLWLSINKYGKENHSIEILELLPDRNSLKLREAEIVNEELLNDTLCMNMALGGGGGFSSDEHKKKFMDAASISRKTTKFSKTMSETVSKLWENDEYRKIHLTPILNSSGFTGHSHSLETIEKIKNSIKNKQKGSSNSQYGTCWITNEKENIKIHKGDLIPEGWRLGRKIK